MSKVSTSSISSATSSVFDVTQTNVYKAFSTTINGTASRSVEYTVAWVNPTGSETKLFASASNHAYQTEVYHFYSSTISDVPTLVVDTILINPTTVVKTFLVDPSSLSYLEAKTEFVNSPVTTRSGNESGSIKISFLLYIMLFINTFFT